MIIPFPTEWKVIKFHGSSHHQPDISLTTMNHYSPLKNDSHSADVSSHAREKTHDETFLRPWELLEACPDTTQGPPPARNGKWGLALIQMVKKTEFHRLKRETHEK